MFRVVFDPVVTCHTRIALLYTADRLMDLLFLFQSPFGNALLQPPQVRQQFSFMGYADRSILTLATLAAAEDVNLVPLLPALDLDPGLFLKWIPCCWFANHL